MEGGGMGTGQVLHESLSEANNNDRIIDNLPM
jgi:hypothetical protein